MRSREFLCCIPLGSETCNYDFPSWVFRSTSLEVVNTTRKLVQIQPHRVSDGMVLCCGPHIRAGAVSAVFRRTPPPLV